MDSDGTKQPSLIAPAPAYGKILENMTAIDITTSTGIPSSTSNPIQNITSSSPHQFYDHVQLMQRLEDLLQRNSQVLSRICEQGSVSTIPPNKMESYLSAPSPHRIDSHERISSGNLSDPSHPLPRPSHSNTTTGSSSTSYSSGVASLSSIERDKTLNDKNKNANIQKLMILTNETKKDFDDLQNHIREKSLKVERLSEKCDMLEQKLLAEQQKTQSLDKALNKYRFVISKYIIYLLLID